MATHYLRREVLHLNIIQSNIQTFNTAILLYVAGGTFYCHALTVNGCTF